MLVISVIARLGVLPSAIVTSYQHLPQTRLLLTSTRQDKSLCTDTSLGVTAQLSMEDELYDTSWTLYFIANTTALYRNFASSDQGSLNGRARQFRDYISSNRPRYEDEEEQEKIGTLRDCTWSRLGKGNTRTARKGIVVSLDYDKTTYKFVFYDDVHANFASLPLLLAKASASLTKKFASFLSETFDVSVNPLRLPPSLLQTTLQSYLQNIRSAFELDDSADTLQFLRPALGSLRLTISFSSLVAPHLRTLEVDVPPETTLQLSRSSTASNISFLQELARHLYNRTGLKIPVLSSSEDGQSVIDGEDAVFRISKIACAAYSLSIDSRIRFMYKAVEGSDKHELVIRKANDGMMGDLIEKATRMGQNG